MIITQSALPRRTFLRGVGVTVAIPFLDAMVPALSQAARAASTPSQRMGFVYIPNGANMAAWQPAGDGGALTLSPILAQLEPFKNQLIVPTGLAHRMAEANGDGNGEHSRASAVWLNGVRVKQTEGADVRAGVTVDQLAAQKLGRDTMLPSLELALENSAQIGGCENGYSCVYTNTLSWRTPTTPLPMELNPRVVFERLFGDGGTAPERLAQLREDGSILDSVTEHTARLQRGLGPGDRARVDQYLEAVREIERRTQASEAKFADETLSSSLPPRPVGIPESYDEYAKMMFDLQWLAFQADITRVFTFLMGKELSNRTYPQVGVPDPHHSTSHHQNDPVRLAKLVKINTYHVSLFAHFLQKLRATPDGDGNLLDHSIIVYGGGISDGDSHSHVDLPLVVAGGGAGQLKGGRHLKFPAYTPMANLMVSLLGKVGVPTEHFGDSTGALPLEPLAGV